MGVKIVDKYKEFNWLFLIFMGAALLFKATFLWVDELAYSYPYISYDGFQWICDGLSYAGHNVEVSLRNPALPFIISILERLDVLNLLPILNNIALFFFFFYVRKSLLIFYNVALIDFVLFFFFINFSIQTFFDFVLADPYAITFSAISIYFLLSSSKKFDKLLLCSFFAAISFLFQYAIAFVLPSFLFYIYSVNGCSKIFERRSICILLFSALIFLTIVSPNFIHRYLEYGDPLYSHVIHFPLLKLNFLGLVYYSFNAISFFGVAIILLAIIGVLRNSKEICRSEKSFINLFLFITFSFWVLFYIWFDRRFLLYFIFPLAFLSVEGLNYLLIKYPLHLNKWKLSSKIASLFLLCYTMTFSLWNLGSPFESTKLPLTPQACLKLNLEPISKFGANSIVNIEKLKIDYYSSYPGVGYLIDYYKPSKRSLDLIDLVEIRKNLKENDSVTSVDHSVPSDYFTKRKIQIALRNNPYNNKSKYMISKLFYMEEDGYRCVYFGEVYSLFKEI